MKCIYRLLLAASFMLSSAALAKGEEPSTSNVSSLSKIGAAERAGVKAIKQKLDEAVEIEVVELELGQLMKDLANKCSVRIAFDPVAMEDAAVTADTLVTAEIHGVTLRSALRQILRPLKLAFVIRDESLVITTADCDDADAIVHAYQIDALPKGIADSRELLDAVRLAWPTIRDETDATPRCRPRAILVGERLIVRGSPRHHEQVEQLLAELVGEGTIAKPGAIKPKSDE